MKRILILLGILTALILPVMFFQVTAAPALPEVCEHCGMAVTWQPLTEAEKDSTQLPSGHYYLDFQGDSYEWAEKEVDGVTCLYLNGKTITGSARAFDVNGTLSIMGEGTIQAPGPTTKEAGGTILVRKSGIVNFYSGTLTSCLPKDGATCTSNGGCTNIFGIFNMYGGTIRDGLVTNTGNNVFVTVNGKFFAYGGTIQGGKGTGSGLVTRGLVQLSGNANIQKMWLYPNTADGGPDLSGMLTVTPDFAGSAYVYTKGQTAGMDIGTAIGQFPGTIKVSTTLTTAVYRGQLLLWGSDPVMGLGESIHVYPSLTEGIAAGQEELLVLQNSVNEDITVDSRVLLDLNGYSVTGNITGSGTLLCRDSKTDDYTVADGVYGEVPVSSAVDAREGYLAVEKAGKVSFHRLNLEITGMALRTEEAGMYFTAAFAGDEVVKENIKTFGLTASVAGDPEQNPASAVRTEIDPEQFGKGIEATSTLIRNIIQPGNRETVNSRNAQMPIYGRAYVQLKNGEYIYGSCQSRSLRQQLEYIDKLWNSVTTLQQSKVVDFYRDNTQLMEAWDVSKVKSVTEGLGNAESTLAALNTLEARRDEVESYMRRQMTVLWQVTEPVTYSFNANSGEPEYEADSTVATFNPGEIFSGLPYTHGNNNMESFLLLTTEDDRGVHVFDNLTTEILNGNGVYRVNNIARIGNDCADSVFAALGRVCSSISFSNSYHMLPYYGCIPVGDYESVAADVIRYPDATKNITAANGESVMYRAYSQMQKADALTVLTESSGGHAIMVSKVVVVLKDGQIDGANSYILFHDQTPKYYASGETRVDEATGLTVRVVGGCDNKLTFRQLYVKGYLPVTFKELNDPAPLETEWVQDSIAARTQKTFFDGVITSNYRIATVTVGISDAFGNPVQQCTRFLPGEEMFCCSMARFINPVEQPVRQGQLDLDSLIPGSYHYTISCRLYTGREMRVSEGTFQIS